MRPAYFLAAVAVLCTAVLMYGLMRPPRPASERAPLIEHAVRESVEDAFRRDTLSRRTLDETYVKALIDDAVDEALRPYVRALDERVAALRAYTPPSLPATTQEEALLQARHEAQVRFERHKKSNADALVMDALRVASDLQSWKLKPLQFGGGRDHNGFEGATFEDIGYEVNADSVYQTVHGTYELVTTAEQAKVIGTNDTFENRVTILITGTNARDVSTKVAHYYGAQ